jgi:hypothetical protein
MMDPDTFLTTLYVMIDDFCQVRGFQEKHRPGPATSLSCSEVMTLAVFGQWARFPSKRTFYRYAVGHLQAQRCLYEALDSSGIPTYDAKRCGTGWLAGQATIGWSNRFGWYEALQKPLILLHNSWPDECDKHPRPAFCGPGTWEREYCHARHEQVHSELCRAPRSSDPGC